MNMRKMMVYVGTFVVSIVSVYADDYSHFTLKFHNETGKHINVRVLKVRREDLRSCKATFGYTQAGGICVGGYETTTKWANINANWESKTIGVGKTGAFHFTSSHKDGTVAAYERVAAIQIATLKGGKVEHCTLYTYSYVNPSHINLKTDAQITKEEFNEAPIHQDLFVNVGVNDSNQSDKKRHVFAVHLLYASVPWGGKHKRLGSLLMPEDKSKGTSGIMVEKQDPIGKKPDEITMKDLTPVRQWTDNNKHHNKWWFPRMKK